VILARINKRIKGGEAMKWGGYSSNASDRMNKFFKMVLGNKGIYYLLMIATLGLLLGAGFKWHP